MDVLLNFISGGEMAQTGQFDLIKAILNQRDQSADLEEKLRRWAKKPSDTETEKCERSVRMIKAAIAADANLSKMDIDVYAKGSFANRTNIPSDSDVDVAVVLKNLFFNDYPDGYGKEFFGFVDAAYVYEDFKRDVAKAITNYFGAEQVTIGNKAIQVHSNSARVDADVVPHTVHRRYSADKSYYEGVALKTASGDIIKNWPAQDYKNGISKNDRTAKRYKAGVRIIKNLRGEMSEKGYKSADKTPSYLISCLMWNVPDHYFDDDSYTKMIEDCLEYLVERTSDLSNVKQWVEINELKWLFNSSQAWKFDDAHDFLVDALSYFKSLK